MMRSVDHPNIVKLHYVYESESKIYFYKIKNMFT